ncbi:DUF2169 family type VI secretion system accessory protein [Acanthopleuribacter pedis]|uniref:DUF2169 domain-containing protein n=1 Tax=Acanthopleuribacter pedis TaxID=442870 RepID=A0A8J7U4D5_9BACT|nr:DUF2169 domain-containing protein [Acanthopleuribacter pedis]MBO1319318.1 DUF2169 domain-containing protein [Acanthopleuribacter pedis]
MKFVHNPTPFSLDYFVTGDARGGQHLTAVLSATFLLPAAGAYPHGPLQPAARQKSVSRGERFTAGPESSLLADQQAVLFRPGCDIALYGKARTPGAVPLTEMETHLKVGSVEKRVRVYGDRVWKRRLVGLTPSAPEAFAEMPLVYERAYGGRSRYPRGQSGGLDTRNPVGIGYYESKRAAAGQPLPNLENPGALIQRYTDRPFAAGYGLISPSWPSRARYAGTFDSFWLAERAPRYPRDIQPRFFQAAHPDLQTLNPLRGDEKVCLTGFSHEGTIQFNLPGLEFLCRCVFRSRRDAGAMALDGLYFDTEAGTVELVYRASFATQGNTQEFLGLHVVHSADAESVA